jgi:hypothetical protein
MNRLLILVSLSLLGARCSEYGVDRIDDEPLGAGDRLIRVDPETIDFGEVAAGTVVTDTFTISSIGEAAIQLEPLHIHGSGTFTIISGELEGSLSPGESLVVEVAYEPATSQDSAEVIVASDAQTQQVMVELAGVGVMPDLVFDPPLLELRSYDGNTVYSSFVARNEGVVDLNVSEWVLQGEAFQVETDLPGTLGPGEETEISVIWTPAVEGTDLGYFWASSNDPDGTELATIEGYFELPCLGLHEAVTRGWADIHSNAEGIVVTHEGEDLDICIDRWYVYISDKTQDAGAGDPSFIEADVYGEDGSVVLSRGDSVTFSYASSSAPAWWCVEETQTTATSYSFDFTGAQVPSMLLDSMLGGGIDPNGTVWQDIRENPMMIVGRERGYAMMVAEGTTLVEVEVINIGRVEGTAYVSETVPAGMLASAIDPEPISEDWDDHGNVTYTWEVSLDAAVDTDIDTQTVYDAATFSYVLEMLDEACTVRARVPAPTVQWDDKTGITRQSAGSPFIIECW